MVTRTDLKLLSEFESGKILTTPEAYKLGYGHYLPGRIYRLRRAGYSIASWSSGGGYHHYSLGKNHIDTFLDKQLSLNI